MSTAEKICRKHVLIRQSYIRFIKRRTHKLWRRMARLDPEGAPRRLPTKGWID